MERVFRWAKHGPVFPVTPNGKEPLLSSNWREIATQDPDQITAWYDEHPDCNWAYAVPEGQVAIDIDVKGGAPGLESMAQHVSPFLKSPTLHQKTPSGGFHLLFQLANGRAVKSAVGWKPGIDLRSHGGYILISPSTIDGVAYDTRWEPMLVIDPELEQFLPEKRKRRSALERGAELVPERSQYSDLPDRIPAGGRDAKLYGFACSFRTRGLSMEHAKAVMEVLISRCEQPPGDEITLEEGLAKVDRAWRDHSPGDDEKKAPETPDAPTHLAEEVEQRKGTLNTTQAFLDRFVYVEHGAQVIDLKAHSAVAVLSLEDFHAAMKNAVIFEENAQGVQRRVQLSKRWQEDEGRKTAKDIRYNPKFTGLHHEDGHLFYSTYTPANLIIPDKADLDIIAPILGHYEYMIGAGAILEHTYNWTAVSLQRRGLKVPHAGILIGKPGTGKSMILDILKALHGSHNTNEVSVEEFAGQGANFNSFMANCTLITNHELWTQKKRAFTELIKGPITQDTAEINTKYGAKKQMKIYFNSFNTSNHHDAISLDKNDRRWLVIESKATPASPSYYKQLAQAIKNPEVIGHLMRWFLDRDLSKFDPFAPPPMTKAKLEMIASSATRIEQIIWDAIETMDDVFQADIVGNLQVHTYVEKAWSSKGTKTLTSGEIYQIDRYILPQLQDPLEQDRYSDGNKEIRMKCVRNRHLYNTVKAVEDEYQVAKEGATGKPLERGNLREAK